MKSCLRVNSVSDNPNIGYSPQQIRAAYNIGISGDGSDISVAVIDFIGNQQIENNLRIFSNQFDLSSANINFYDSNNVNSDYNFSAYIEPCADTQWVHAISEKAVLNVFRADSYSVEGAVRAITRAIEYSCDIILMTFQAPFLVSYLMYNDLFESNTVFIASAGDYGGGAFFPSCYQGCISVGGTSLLIGSQGERLNEETVWNGTGGGICGYIDIPEYQFIFNEINTITNGKRGVPDLAMLADPDNGYSVYHSSVDGSYGWYKMGGTSLSASVIAGIIANYLSVNRSVDRRNVLPLLYKLAGETSYTNPYNKFIDITVGNNGIFSARQGYDLCTGLGSITGF